MQSIALLSHRFSNIGHNFMALGAEQVARQAFGESVQITHFEQHHPFSIYPDWDWLRLLDRLPHGRLRRLRARLASEDVYRAYWQRTRRLSFGLAVACGGPNLIAEPFSGESPALGILFHHFNGAFHHQGVPVIDAAVGSAFPLTRIPEALTSDAAAFYRKSLSYVSFLAVRDAEAQRLFRQLGADPPLLPCIAIGSGRLFEPYRKKASNPERDGYVVVNFQAKGSNDDWGQGVDPTCWMAEVRGVIADLKAQGERVVLLCHSKYELRLAKQLDPTLPATFPETEHAYAEFIAGAKMGFVSRIHAAIALAGIGVPSVVVGNDTRIGTTAEMGLTSVSTLRASREQIVQAMQDLSRRLDAERDRLLALREFTIDIYSKHFACQARRN